MVTTHVLSFDVEHWYDGNLHRQWTAHARTDHRFESEMSDLLELLDQTGTKATFFVLGSAAADSPDVVRRIAAQGHEVACHAFDHLMLCNSTPTKYLAGLKRCRALLQDLSGQPVEGHRAPSWSIDRRVPWALDVLLEAGFTYDSSIFPMRTPLYGEPAAPTTPFWLTGADDQRILELPPAVRRFGPVTIPYGGGAYWRLLPAWMVSALLRRSGTTQVTYLHPWELNPIAAPVPSDLPFMPRLVLQFGVGKARFKLKRLLKSFDFHPIATLANRVRQETNIPTFRLAGG